LLDRLQAHGARLGLLTGNMQGGARLKLGATGLLDRFDFGLSAFAEDGFDRTELAEAARRRCGEGALTVVGDTVADIECARHIDARVLAVSTGPQEHVRLERARPDRLEADLTESDAIADWLLAPH
jgi:phosphoglycolate phosphatase-like HAD superfamily hydrolase